jgi:hypothetical protein
MAEDEPGAVASTAALYTSVLILLFIEAATASSPILACSFAKCTLKLE